MSRVDELLRRFYKDRPCRRNRQAMVTIKSTASCQLVRGARRSWRHKKNTQSALRIGYSFPKAMVAAVVKPQVSSSAGFSLGRLLPFDPALLPAASYSCPCSSCRLCLPFHSPFQVRARSYSVAMGIMRLASGNEKSRLRCPERRSDVRKWMRFWHFAEPGPPVGC